jgi:hypothetical protein
MYCGVSIELKEEISEAVSEVNVNKIEAEYRNALNNIAVLVNEVEKILPLFNKANYNTSFERYINTCNPILIPIERQATLGKDNLMNTVEETTRALVDAIDIKLKESNSILSSSKNIDQYRFFLAIYLVPMVRYLRYEISEPLAEQLILEWRERYPKFEFYKGSYEEFEAGFVPKGLCFITTAVCSTLNKQDDCYELSALRQFRDTYMQDTKERQLLVAKYYHTAPAIVASIDTQPKAKEKYYEIWNKYIEPCLMDLEHNRPEECIQRYATMVQDLVEEYHVLI